MSKEMIFEMLKKSEEEINDMFNSGMFNSITIGYGKLALKEMDSDEDFLRKFEKALNCVFDFYDSKDARNAYLKL